MWFPFIYFFIFLKIYIFKNIVTNHGFGYSFHVQLPQEVPLPSVILSAKMCHSSRVNVM